jgi:hypothetical protein
MKQCSVDGCIKDNRTRGRECGMHAARLYRTGSYELHADSREKQFIDMIDITENCWLWKGHRNKSGYGRTCFKRRLFLAHRLSYLLFVGVIPPGMNVCHTCDAPLCVNPSHLWLGTHKDNAMDKALKGRSIKGRKMNQQYSENEILAIKDIFKLQLKSRVFKSFFNISKGVYEHLKEYYHA